MGDVHKMKQKPENTLASLKETTKGQLDKLNTLLPQVMSMHVQSGMEALRMLGRCEGMIEIADNNEKAANDAARMLDKWDREKGKTLLMTLSVVGRQRALVILLAVNAALEQKIALEAIKPIAPAPKEDG